ncbi:MAG: hypothetical protein OEM82_05195 [Acidobacteriota bacterium]|nr:hypothetical protein [Acidobacteriota bacterium]MDH3530949.1 hypothetical protein [Acidobacteriota bacterium]
MKNMILVFFAFVMVGFFGQSVLGCSCVVSSKKQNINYKKWLKRFDGAAFTGRVVRIEKSEESMESKVTFAVRTFWRGVEGKEAVIFTSSDSGLCGIDYTEGEEYIVFADRSGNRFTTNSCTEMTYSEYRAGFLRALGKAKRASNPDDPPPQKIDEFGRINCEDEMARLDLFAVSLQNDPSSIGFIIIYGGEKGKRNEAKVIAQRMTNYLVNNRGLDPGRFFATDGGFRKTLTGELWIARENESNPVATPSIDAKAVTFKGKAKARNYRCNI